MLNDVYQEMTTLTKVDSFCRDFYLRNGHYMVNPTIEEIKALLEMWGKLEDVMSEEDLNVQLETGRLADLIDIFSRESLAFEEGKDVNILSANRYFEMTEHQHSYFEIECVVDGSAIHNPGKNQIYLKKGDIVLIPPQTSHITQPIDGSTIVDLQIRFSTFEITFKDILSSKFPISSYFKNSLYGKGARECVILDGMLDETVLEILALIWKENGNNTFVSRKQCAHFTEALLYHLAEVVAKEHIFDVCEYQNEEIYQIRRYMLEHMERVTLAELAKNFHRSDSVISRYIKKRSGKGFSELLQNMRLERAADLLLATNMDVSEIGYSVGYAGESHFISCFRKKYGMTPLQYRRSRTGGIRG